MVASEFQYCKLSITNWGGNVWSNLNCHSLGDGASLSRETRDAAKHDTGHRSVPHDTGHRSVPQRIVWSCSICWIKALVVLLTSMNLILPTRLQGCQGTKLIRSFRRLLIFLLHYCGSNPSSASSWTCDCMCVCETLGKLLPVLCLHFLVCKRETIQIPSSSYFEVWHIVIMQ